ncbi:hypothetical protein NC652_020227 [Populus alba x Populus x berolinensis]|nr:hypothetical protein NC652_020227 [Populus alba x Populus x berolinensis]
MKLQFLLIITSSPFFIDPRMSSPEATTALSVPSFYPGRVSQMVIIYNVQHPRSGFEDNIDGSLSYFWFHTCSWNNPTRSSQALTGLRHQVISSWTFLSSSHFEAQAFGPDMLTDGMVSSGEGVVGRQ